MGRVTGTTIAAALVLVLVAGPATGQTTHLDPSDGAWQFTGDTEAGIVDGSPALMMRTGQALRRDLDFEDGVIEFEYRGTDDRAFLGVTFRVGDDGTGEDVYLRLHKGKQPDALQYTPDFRGRGQWQLWHGPDATAFANLRPAEWTPVRIEVSGSRAEVTVGAVDSPQLVTSALASGRNSGSIGFWANQPGAGADAPLTAAIRNIRVTPSTAHAGEVATTPTADPGAVRAWGVSDAFQRPGDDVLEVPHDVVSGPWTVVEARADGLLSLEPQVERSNGPGVPAVVAALRLEADRERTARLDLGFSDDASVFLNGRLLYSGRHSFSTNFPRRQGLISLDQASLYLPLHHGENLLMVVVSDAFGGWGVMGRIVDRTGLQVEPWRDSVSAESAPPSIGAQRQPQPQPQPTHQPDWRDREYGIGVVTYPATETDALSGVILSRPSRSADTVATFGGRELCYADRPGCLRLHDRTIEYDYEIAGWAILGFNGDGSWARVSLDPFGVDSVSEGWVWLEPSQVRPLLWSDELLENYLFFLWPDSIRFFSSPDSSRSRDLELASFPEPRRYDYILRPMKAQGHWLQVEVFSPLDGCGIPDSVEPDTAWIRYLSPTGRPRVFYFTRGC